MCAKDYLEFSGIHPLPGQPLCRSVSFPFTLSSLNLLKDLDTIDFRFISPKHKFAACPWGDLHSCRKKWMDLFFVDAWDALKMLKGSKGVKYTLGGCVKNSARDYWMGLRNDRRVDHATSVKALEQNVYASMTDDTPLEYECTNPCVGGSKLFQVEPQEVRLIEGLQAEMDKVYWDLED